MLTLRGKIGGLIYSHQRNGTVTVRGVGTQRAPSTPGEKKGQDRFKLGHGYVRWALSDPELRAAYTEEACKRGLRPYDVAMGDFLTDPVVAGIDLSAYAGQRGDPIIVVTGDDFKVVRLRVVLTGAFARSLEEGFAVPAEGSVAKAWVYTAQLDAGAGQVVAVRVIATDRCGHSTEQSKGLPL